MAVVHLTDTIMDRAVGSVLASAAGDALGAPYEFGPTFAGAPCRLEGGGSFGWEPGEWTDDTQMALAVLSVLASGSTDTDAIGQAMKDWYVSRPADVGNQIRAVLSDALRRAVPASEAAAAYQEQEPEAAGNGALMRTGPVALAHLGDRSAVARLASQVAELTHPHPDSVDACVLWSLAIESAIVAEPGDPFDFERCVSTGLDEIDADRRDRWRRLIGEALGASPTRWADNNGWVVGAFQAAVATITCTEASGFADGPEHLVQSLERAARSGGDTDTVAAIAGALLGAHWGASAIPAGWLALLHGRRRYDEPALRAHDLDAMVRLAVTRLTGP